MTTTVATEVIATGQEGRGTAAAARLSTLKRLSHALGHAASGSASAPAAVDALAAAIEAVKQGMERHALALEMDLLEPASEWVQFEPEDPHGAELRSALAAAVQVTRPPASLAQGCTSLTCPD